MTKYPTGTSQRCQGHQKQGQSEKTCHSLRRHNDHVARGVLGGILGPEKDIR